MSNIIKSKSPKYQAHLGFKCNKKLREIIESECIDKKANLTKMLNAICITYFLSNGKIKDYEINDYAP